MSHAPANPPRARTEVLADGSTVVSIAGDWRAQVATPEITFKGDRIRLTAAEQALNGSPIDDATIAAAARAACAMVEPQDDIHASAAYRRALVGTLTERALARACA